jgi:hypothetical protein
MKKSFFVLLGLFLGITTISFAQTKSVSNSIIAYLKANYNDASETSRHFIYNAVDLNDDGKEEYLVELIGSDWCGSGGCTVLILDKNFKLNTRMTVVNDPIYVGAPGGKEVTNGYSNIYIQNKNGSVVKMVWNGKKYPTNPSVAPKVDKKIIAGKYKFLNIEKQEQLTF